ncbi:MAG: hypothetical protein AAB374_00290, partial [Patescibacteria group bacterium]
MFSAPSTPTPDSTDNKPVPATGFYLDARPLTKHLGLGLRHHRPNPSFGVCATSRWGFGLRSLVFKFEIYR